MKIYICPGCHFKSKNIYDFSPSIQIAENDFRIFHPYEKKIGHLYCIQCKRHHLLKIADEKNLTLKNINFIKKKIKEDFQKFEKATEKLSDN